MNFGGHSDEMGSEVASRTSFTAPESGRRSLAKANSLKLLTSCYLGPGGGPPWQRGPLGRPSAAILAYKPAAQDPLWRGTLIRDYTLRALTSEYSPL